MLLNVKDVKSILKTLDIDSNSFFKKINLHLDQIQEKLIGIHFYRVMDIETGKYHFYRLNTTTNETIEDDWCVKTYQRIAGLSKKRMELKELKEYLKKNHE